MSESFPGLPPPPPPKPPRPATAVILWRQGPQGREVFWVRRGEPLAFAGGFHAFPGGKIDAGDHTIAVEGATGNDAAQVVSACRELFEETGVLLARGAERLTQAQRKDARERLLAGSVTFAALLAQHSLLLRADQLERAGRWITPPFLPIGYDAQLFLTGLPPGESAEVWPGELADGQWIACERALELWSNGTVLLHPPNHWAIECLSRSAPPAVLEALRSPPYCDNHVARRIDFQRGLYLVPLETPTLPPATHTNCYVLDLGDSVAVVDPGSPDVNEQRRLERILDEFADDGKPARAIWLTHHHGDHIGGVEALAAKTRAPVLAHARTADRLAMPGLDVRLLADGDAPAPGWRALHTPGHARGHLSFLHDRSGALLCGDMVSTLSTIVIDPPEGEMAEYLRQLDRLRSLPIRTLYPAHGPPATNAMGKLAEYLAHRRGREAKIAAALSRGGTLSEVTAIAYDDTPEFLHPVAERSCLATLEKLEGEGRAHRQGERWLAA